MKRHSRRTFLGGGAALVGGAAATLAAPAVHGQATTTISLLGYIGDFKDIYIRTVIEPFQRANPRIAVEYKDGGNSVQMIGQLRAQRRDLLALYVVLDKSQHRFRVIEDVRTLARGVGRVRWAADGAYHRRKPDALSRRADAAGFRSL